MRRQKLDIQNKTHANLLLNKIEKMELASFQSKPSFMFKAAKYLCQSFRGFCQLFSKQCLLQYRHKKRSLAQNIGGKFKIEICR